MKEFFVSKRLVERTEILRIKLVKDLQRYKKY